MSVLKRINPRSARRFVRLSVQRWRLRGDAVECPICGFEACHFADGHWHVRSVCPKCRTETRHRLLLASLTRLPQWHFDRIVTGKRVLHFAPEPAIRRMFRERAGTYQSADLMHPDADLRLDIGEMPSVADGAFDCCVACDVLEHVPNDRDALRELHRITAPGGVTIITVPQKDHAATTHEDSTVITPADRKRVYGQEDHVRFYGDDVVDRMVAAGFEVTAVDAECFPPEVVERLVLRPPVLSDHPLVTNFRKVFFCRRPT